MGDSLKYKEGESVYKDEGQKILNELLSQVKEFGDIEQIREQITFNLEVREKELELQERELRIKEKEKEMLLKNEKTQEELKKQKQERRISLLKNITSILFGAVFVGAGLYFCINGQGETGTYLIGAGFVLLGVSTGLFKLFTNQ